LEWGEFGIWGLEADPGQRRVAAVAAVAVAVVAHPQKVTFPVLGILAT